ncbi:MAG TPA: galactonate dehydratase [Thermomicrobiales bacterium]|nr:galactonate dehydratase [Thermomicrobiales bacterium]
MKITGFELFKVPPRWLFLKVSTDAGIAGWGEPVVEGRADTVRAAVEELSHYLIGRDPFRIEDTFQVLYRGGFYRGGPVLTSALSGIEQALWDIKGRALGVPVYELLGGAARDKMRIYGWIGGDRPHDVAEAARAQVAAGMTAVKMNATEELHYIDSHARVEEAVARLAAVREAGGPDFGIGVDFHGRVHKSMAKALARELGPYHPMFIEEPVLPENNEALREIARHTTVPIATGERMYTRWDFKPLLVDGYVDIVQPDLSHAGGILEVRKIAAMAEAFDVAVAPHCPLGPIALAASLQVDACTPNAFIQEQSLGIHYNQGSDLLDYLADPGVFRHEGGFIPLLTGPGLGIEIDEATVRERAQTGHGWHSSVWRNADGTVAEW